MSMSRTAKIETLISADQKVPGIIANLRTLYQYRELLYTLATRDIKVRYKQSALGIAWAIMRPLSLMLIFTIVFSRLARIPSEGIAYPIFSYCALLPWTLFAASLTLASQSLVNNMSLVTKIYFPREVFPFASVAACFVDFAVASSIFVGLMVYYHVGLTLNALWIPVIVLVQVLFVLGVSLFTSAVNVYYRDIRHVIPVAVQLWMYATPIIYPITLIPEKYRDLYMLNPMAVIIDSYRRILLSGQPPNLIQLALAAMITVCLFLSGYIYFKHVEPGFADII